MKRLRFIFLITMGLASLILNEQVCGIEATDIELNTEYSDVLSPKGEVDFFKFDLPTDGNVVVTFRHEGFSDNANVHWNVYLYSEADIELPLGFMAIKATDRKASFSTGIGAGTYLIKVTPDYYGSSSDVKHWWRDQYFLKVQTDVAQPICPQVITYGKNPVSGNWISFPTPCDVPEGWITQNTKPDGPCPICPTIEVATCPELEISRPTIAVTLSPTLDLHIPDIQYEGLSFWADFVNVPSPDENLLFKVTNYGQN